MDIKSLILVGVGVLLGAMLFLIPGVASNRFGAVDVNSSNTLATSTAKIASSTVSQLFTPEPGVQHRSITNTGINVVWLTFNNSSSGIAAGRGYPLSQSSTLNMYEGDFLWKGSVWAITTQGTSSVSLSQL